MSRRRVENSFCSFAVRFFHSLPKERRVISSHGDIVQEEQRFGAGAQQIVHAHRHQIDSDRIVPPGLLRDLQLCAHTVGTTDQYRVLVVACKQPAVEIELKKTRETTIAGDHARRMRAVHQPR